MSKSKSTISTITTSKATLVKHYNQLAKQLDSITPEQFKGDYAHNYRYTVLEISQQMIDVIKEISLLIEKPEVIQPTKQVKFITNKYLNTLIGKQFNVGNYSIPIVCTCKSILRFNDRLIVTVTTDKSQFDYTNIEFVKSIIQ